jgi:hypothetical protein
LPATCWGQPANPLKDEIRNKESPYFSLSPDRITRQYYIDFSIKVGELTVDNKIKVRQEAADVARPSRERQHDQPRQHVYKS